MTTGKRVAHLRAILSPEVPVCRKDMGRGDVLVGEGAATCSDCLAVRAGAWIHSTKRTFR